MGIAPTNNHYHCMCRGSTPLLNIRGGDMCDTESHFTIFVQIKSAVGQCRMIKAQSMSSVLKVLFPEKKCTECFPPHTYQITLNTKNVKVTHNYISR